MQNTVCAINLEKIDSKKKYHDKLDLKIYIFVLLLKPQPK